MAQRKLGNYLRMHRKKLGLNQGQVAFLLGCKSGAIVCRYERATQEPNLRTALAFEVIYSKPIREIFAGIYDEVEKEVSRRARRLAKKLSKEKRAEGGRRLQMDKEPHS